MLFIGSERAKQRGRLRMWATWPVIYSMFIPLFILDIWTRLYQAICFPLYGIPRVDRSRFVRLSHRGTRMVHALDRFHCLYCSYANGVMGFARAVIAETEKYWCPIKYTSRKGFVAPEHHAEFVADGDEHALREKIVISAR